MPLKPSTIAFQRAKRAFESEEAEQMVAVGATDARRTRIWVRTTRPGPHHLTLWPEGSPQEASAGLFEVPSDPVAGGTTSVCWPDDFEGRPLAPSTSYGFRVSTPEGRLVGAGRFETAPDRIDAAPDHFSIALLSCHQPFTAHGQLHPRSKRQLQVLDSIFAAHDVKRAILIGDQMYADMPESLSLFCERYFRSMAPNGRRHILDCTREEVRQLYQRRYRIFWKDRWTRRMLAQLPCYPVLDDHELVDNFGSSPEHADLEWASLREGALDACFDYQGLRMQGRPPEGVRPRSMHFGFCYGPVAGFVMDIRSERRVTPGGMQLYTEAQLADLARFLKRHEHHPIMLIGLSVPLVHIPDWVSTLGAKLVGKDSDAADRWSYWKARPARDRLIGLLHAHQSRCPHQKLILLGGDVHVGMAARLHWRRPELTATELISSAISNLESPFVRTLSGLAPRLGQTFVLDDDFPCDLALLEDPDNHHDNPYSGLNVGIVEVTRAGRGFEVRLKLIGHTSDGAVAPRVALSTAPI